MRLLSPALLAVALLLGACNQPDLGLCIQEEGQALVFDRQGYPAFAGQAIVEQSCTSCHSSATTGLGRRGAPFHLNFDTVGSRAPDPSMLTEDQMARVEAVQAARQSIFDHRFSFFSSIESGSMPPGAAGEAVQLHAGYTTITGEPLPTLESVEGREIVRTWLACGAPMVERSADDGMVGEPCSGSSEEVGDYCFVKGTGVIIEPTWGAIFENIIEPKCTFCHTDDTAFTEQSRLNLATASVAYDAMVGVDAMGDHPSTPCADTGTVRVVPNDPDQSLLVHKIEGSDASGASVCGDVMPTGGMLSAAEIAVIRAWIEMGAAND